MGRGVKEVETGGKWGEPRVRLGGWGRQRIVLEQQ